MECLFAFYFDVLNLNYAKYDEDSKLAQKWTVKGSMFSFIEMQ